MSAFALPATAPFDARQLAALNQALSGSTAEQRTWLAGFLAGFAAASGGAQALPAGAPAAAAPAKKIPLTIAYVTESGNCEAVAADVAKAAGKLGFQARIADLAETDPASLARADNLLLVAATWGEGDPPERAAENYHALFAEDAPRFDGRKFAVLALGDSAYVNFCEVGRRLDERLEALGGERVAPLVECDVDFEAPAAEWTESTLKSLKDLAGEAAGDADSVIHVDFAGAPESAYSRTNPFPGEITERVMLTGSRSSKQTYHMEVSLEGSGLTYQPGDALGVLPRNDPAVATAVAEAVGLGSEDGLIAELTEGFDITTLSARVIEGYAALIGDSRVKDKVTDRARDADYLAAHGLIDLFRDAPARLTADQLKGLLRALPPRLYSIASSMKVVGEQADLLIAATRFDVRGEARGGVASIDLLERRKVGDRLPVHVKPNKHFRLPASADTPIIMIGPGTGVAPYRGFLQDRAADGVTGKSWLFFGERNYTHDFLYQLDWQDFLKDGVLTRLDVAFSRDAPEKRYVQHALWDRRKEVHGWLQEGAVIYVCGDEQNMARDVEAMLTAILADQGGLSVEDAAAELVRLRKDNRYLKDVY